ncbi:MAG: TIGR03936 family radical SAM-associated protein [Candidatus Caldatribacteriaceae bacterium]
MAQFRYRLRQWKIRPFHLISQLDMSRLWDRLLRKSGTPILYSQGFNPRPLLSFGPATPLGVESKAEYLEMFLGKEVPVLVLQEKLNRYLPEELGIREVTLIPLQAPSLMREMKGVQYAFSFPGISSWNGASLPEGIEVQEVHREMDALQVLFLFRGEKVFFSPLKFSLFLQKNFDYPFPNRIVKEEVFFP